MLDDDEAVVSGVVLGAVVGVIVGRADRRCVLPPCRPLAPAPARGGLHGARTPDQPAAPRCPRTGPRVAGASIRRGAGHQLDVAGGGWLIAGPSALAQSVTRLPDSEDLVSLCRNLEREGARHVVIGGMAVMAVIQAGLAAPRTTLTLIDVSQGQPGRGATSADDASRSGRARHGPGRPLRTTLPLRAQRLTWA